MSESVNRDHLIEIGDPNDESVAVAQQAPQVVIEYRDRGLPWMLVLPLLVTAASVAVIGFKAFDRRTRPEAASATVVAPPADPITPSPLPTSPTNPPGLARLDPTNLGSRDLGPGPMPPPSPVALPPEAIPPPSDIVATPTPAASEPAPAVVSSGPATLPAETPESAPAQVPAQEVPAGLPRVKEFGIDLEALERAEVKPDAVQQAAQPPAAVPAAAEPELPQAVDPNVLPVDPRVAVRERVERDRQAIQRNEAERVRFHADLRAVLKRFDRTRSGPIIVDLCRRYGYEPLPAAKMEAIRLLNGRAAGASRRARVELFRSLGWPEAAILLDMVNHQSKLVDKTAKDGPRNENDVLRACAVYLLGIPPRPPATPVSPAR